MPANFRKRRKQIEVGDALHHFGENLLTTQAVKSFTLEKKLSALAAHYSNRFMATF
jgi:hypothetical protein